MAVGLARAGLQDCQVLCAVHSWGSRHGVGAEPKAGDSKPDLGDGLWTLRLKGATS